MSSTNPQQQGNTAAQASGSNSTTQPVTNKDLPTLGPLDEDDEFEEFEVQDWDDSQTVSSAVKSSTGSASLTMAGSNTTGQTEANGAAQDHLWEDNWDDDDTEDEWSKSLREHLAQ